MSVVNPNRLSKTARVGNAKLPTAADRLGAGFVAGVGTPYPPAVPSRGQFPLPRLPEPEPQLGAGREDIGAEPMPPSGPGPRGPAGSTSGPTASRRGPSLAPTGPVTAAAAAPRSNAMSAKPFAVALPGALVPSRAGYPGSHRQTHQVGRDCQSPDRSDDAWDRDATPPRRGWRRMPGSAATA